MKYLFILTFMIIGALGIYKIKIDNETGEIWKEVAKKSKEFNDAFEGGNNTLSEIIFTEQPYFIVADDNETIKGDRR
jgi:hypothetical protein